MVIIDASSVRKSNLPLGSLPLMEAGSHKSMLLVPFEVSNWSPRLLESAVKMAERVGAELVFLCVRRCTEIPRDPAEDERHFSALRSLQAQLNHRDVSVRIETIVGPTAHALLDYVNESGTRMILVPAEETTPLGSDRETITA